MDNGSVGVRLYFTLYSYKKTGWTRTLRVSKDNVLNIVTDSHENNPKKPIEGRWIDIMVYKGDEQVAYDRS